MGPDTTRPHSKERRITTEYRPCIQGLGVSRREDRIGNKNSVFLRGSSFSATRRRNRPPLLRTYATGRRPAMRRHSKPRRYTFTQQAAHATPPRSRPPTATRPGTDRCDMSADYAGFRAFFTLFSRTVKAKQHPRPLYIV
jgi:hypothetical protein